MLSMSTVTALFDGNRAEAREVFEGMRTADYISPEDILKQPKRKKLKNCTTIRRTTNPSVPI